MNRVFRSWQRYSVIIMLNEKISVKKIEKRQIIIKQPRNNRDNRADIVVVYRALLLLKISWKIWYGYSEQIKMS